jgi:hypothetical protein
MGRRLLNLRLQLQRLMAEKWHGTFPATYVPDWDEIWIKIKPQKEAGFLWSVYHKAVAVNQWRARIFGANADCTNCLGRERESIIHRFHHCPKARRPGPTVSPSSTCSWKFLKFKVCGHTSPGNNV